jgi:outer membrane protein
MTNVSRAALMAIAAVGIAAAQTKVGIVNSQKAMLDTSEIKKAQADLEAKYRPRQEQLAKLQQDISTLQTQLSGGKLTPSAQQDLTVQGQRKEREMQRVQEDLQNDVEHDRNDILGRTSKRMQEIVAKIAEQKGLDVVVDSSNTIYFKPALDLTAEATAQYDKTYPAAGAAAK